MLILPAVCGILEEIVEFREWHKSGLVIDFTRFFGVLIVPMRN
ncbi:Protein of unknown function [Thermobacillus xylanilyticus]|uniref:Uncharacterized protein n=1 Tax=Thermobacillus xylanilyticus TaxID=76633 RepID=A0ABN7RN50_THEXY|nr:Protein of unknown function [Thermobacillus xylanilyticus]